ncbi:hypothetical protein [Sphingomonas sp. Leaf62]|uniref:hypothetical protein n=1 Tax=Sphingomonas sp. Leaf62 TaxID=1736228 RepID=UPI0006F1E522|nr:hypothetical protein [Sphingomonas sp. Leaf62]KQN71761.1 hypothetical protein ASE91_03320 [Sphingomonas sp. Leaf62]
MAQILIATVAIAILLLMSRRANRKFSNMARLPMQWSLSGSVNWTAPRRIALAITPTLALAVLTAATFATLTLTPRRGQEGLEVPVIALLSAGFVAAHAFHLWLIDQQLTSNRG